jgi:hypothetical protein
MHLPRRRGAHLQCVRCLPPVSAERRAELTCERIVVDTPVRSSATRVLLRVFRVDISLVLVSLGELLSFSFFRRTPADAFSFALTAATM